ncbi:MAG: O-methyltransferase [Saprospiraceae bacterium]|nr:O-methyltransferase [Saprospiraceae bacterium]
MINPKIEQYAEAHTTPESAVLQSLVRETHLKTLAPRMLSGHLQGRFLSLIAKLMQPRRVLEIGTFTGYSALCLTEGVADGGVLYALEGNDELKHIIEKYIEKSGYQDKIKLLIGNALEIIPTLDEFFDLVFIDAGKRDYPQYWDLVVEKTRSGGLILADNVLWSGKIVEEKKNLDTQILDSFNKKVLTDDRVECLLLPLRDGLMMALKK